MRKLWLDEAWEEYLYWQTQDKKTLKKVNKLLLVLVRYLLSELEHRYNQE